MVEKKRFDGSDATGATGATGAARATGMLRALRARAAASGAGRGVIAAVTSVAAVAMLGAVCVTPASALADVNACFASMFVRQVRQCFSVVWADGFPRCRHRFPVM